ncbi:MAG: BlaI/MecI/CopY family transcriptional regulator [Candidatus Eremiobacteraeota bacterium]|nr:BlaI/MecI/CopY family transcriptional regulator [Candidatus Eremiobacteraeota bacterium]MBC5820692.1 BlaI/MecI/CopY family transcriptional regulator [Candidatus Eremiobacteraeota bacterium]
MAGTKFRKSFTYKPQAKGSGQALGTLQSRVMEHLWLNGPASLAAIQRDLSARAPVAYTTISTELTRLLDKGLVKKAGAHRETRYAAVLNREQFIDRVVGDVVNGLLDAHGQAAIHGFVDAIADDDEALETTLRLLRKRRRDG